MDLPAGFTLTPWPWELTRPSSGLGSRVRPNTSPTTCQSSVKSLCLFSKILLQTARIPGGDDSRSVHRLSEQPHQCRNDTGGQDTDSRESTSGKSNQAPPHGRRLPSPGCLCVSHEAAPGLRSARLPSTRRWLLPRRRLERLPRRPACSLLVLPKESHLQFLQRYSTKAPSHC